MKRVLFLLFVILIYTFSYAFQFPGIVDIPTCGMLEKAQFIVPIHMEPQGGVITGFDVQLGDDISVGATYGGGQIIGIGAPDWYKIPGIQLKYRIIPEKPDIPAVAVGFSSQGHGKLGYDGLDEEGNIEHYDDIYEFRSKGFYAVASKNWDLLGDLNLHFGFNYSMEKADDPDTQFSMFTGVMKQINDAIYAGAEYDFAFNEKRTLESDKGILNLTVKVKLMNNFVVQGNVKDALESMGDFQRSITFNYIITIK